MKEKVQKIKECVWTKYVDYGQPSIDVPDEEALDLLDVTPLKGQGVGARCKSFARIPAAMKQASSLMRGFDPDLVLGVGGYASGPVLLSASLSGRPTAILEQNAHVGMTNRILSRFVDRAYISFEQTKEIFGGTKSRLTGNPVRHEFDVFGVQPGLLLKLAQGGVEGLVAGRGEAAVHVVGAVQVKQPAGGEQAGGAATDGERRTMELVPQSLHERSPLVIGSLAWPTNRSPFLEMLLISPSRSACSTGARGRRPWRPRRPGSPRCRPGRCSRRAQRRRRREPSP